MRRHPLPYRLEILYTTLIGLFIFIGSAYGAPEVSPLTPDAATAGEASSAAKNDFITLDFKEADINTVLRVMSLKSNVNIVAGPEVQGSVTVRLENVPWEKALDVVLRTYDYVYERDGNIIRVTTREKMAQEPVVTQTFILNYTKAVEIQAAVQDMLTERGRIKVAERTNTMVITDIPTNLYRISEVIKKLDQVTPQAFIDSKIVSTSLGASENLGIDWNIEASLDGTSRPTTFPFATFTDAKRRDTEQIGHVVRQFFPNIVGDEGTPNTRDPRAIPFPAGAIAADSDVFDLGTLDLSTFSMVMQYLKTRTDSKVVSNPRIVVLNNQTAKVQVGSQIPIPAFERNSDTGSMEVSDINYKDIGVVLNVTPHINSAEEILVELKPEVSSRGDDVDFGEFLAPSFNITAATTQVLIRSSETIAIGGLMTDAVRTAEQRIPYLSDLPFVGKLFRSKRQDSDESNEKVETLFFITVTMVDTEGQPTGRLADGRTIHNPRAEKNKKAEAAQKVEKTDSPSEPEPPITQPSSIEVQKVQPASQDVTESQITEEAPASSGA